MKLIIVAILIFTTLWSDKVVMNSIGCEDIDVLAKLNQIDATDSLKLTQFAIQNNCTILSPDDKIKVLDKLVTNTNYDLALSLIQLNKTGNQLYVYKKSLFIEQAGNKNKFKF